MLTTYNQILERIKTISLSHKQVKNYYYGRPTDFLTEKTTLYTSVFLQDNNGSLSIPSKVQTSSFKLFVLDLVNVSDNTLTNIKDVQSDCLEIAKDLVALMDNDVYSDWSVTGDSNWQFLFEEFDDLVAGVVIDITIRTPYLRDTCAVPLV